jgi:hypothetical protein
MNEIQFLLNNIYKCLEKTNSPLIKSLNERIDRKYVNAQLKSDNLKFPEDAYSLYEWKNGINDNEEYLMGNITFFPLGIFSSFERAHKSYYAWVGKDDYWTKSLFPLFETGGWGFHLLECNPLSKNYGMIYRYDISAYEFDTIIGKYDSMKTLLQTINECYELGIYTYNKDNIFEEIDYEKTFEISRKYNPRCHQYWNLFI